MSKYDSKRTDLIELDIKKFFYDMQKNECTMCDVIKKIVQKEWKKEEIFFSIGVEYNNSFYYFNENEKWMENEVPEIANGRNKIDVISEIFKKCIANIDVGIQFCRCVACWENDKNEMNTIYYFCGVKKCENLCNMYFQAIDKSYFKWLSEQLLYVKNTIGYPASLFEKKNYRELICKQTVEEFYKLILQLYQLDLSIITKLSGSYYEGESCSANLVFQIDLSTEWQDGGVVFQEPVEVNEESIRKIRKLLQMGKKNQHLLAVWNCENKRWEIKGLYEGDGSSATNIVFGIVQHMAWNMEINKKRIICYKCGEHVIESVNFKEEEFEEHFQKTFGKQTQLNVKKVFKKALQQTYGTVLIILQKEKAAKEIERMLKDSVGIGLVNLCLPEAFIDSVTSIDGALCIDEEGVCYGIGMILDSSEKIVGHAGRGARYTSTMKYIKKCEKEHTDCVAVVVSEDKMVNIFSTGNVKMRKI